MTYINGYMMRQLKHILRNCPVCLSVAATTTVVDDLHREVQHSSAKMNGYLTLCFQYANEVLPLPEVCLGKKVRDRLCEVLMDRISVDFPCLVHNTKEIVTRRFAHFFIHSWCMNVNHFLKGSDMSWNITFNDEVKKKAQARCSIYKSRNRGVGNIKKLKM